MGDSRAPFRRFASLLIVPALVALMTATSVVPAMAVGGQTYVQLTNVKRASVGKPPVAFSSAIDQITVERAQQLASTDVFAHDLAYVTRRMTQLGLCYTGYGEIIAWESGYATYDYQRTINQWWASPTHQAIMLGDYNAAGGSHAKSSASGKTYSVMVFAKLCQAPAVTASDVSRLAGSDRYATAAAISRSRFAAGVPVVYLATGVGFPDALSAAAAVASKDGPVLLTARDALPSATATELARLKPARIVVVGGTGVISDAVARAADAYTAGSVTRLAGADRYATAAAVSRSSFSSGRPVVYISTGQQFADALGGSAAAGRDGGPILLVQRGSVPSSTATELARLKPGRIVVLGGSAAVSDAVVAALSRYASGGVTRIAGSDRYATAVKLSRAGFASDAASVYVATGAKFADGLAGGPVAALLPAPLLLVTSTTVPSAVGSEVQRLAPDRIVVLGGSEVVSNSVVQQLDALVP